MPKYRSNRKSAEVGSRIDSRLINGLSRRGMHGAAVKVSKSHTFVSAFGRFALANALYRAERYAEAFVEFVRAYREHPDSSEISRRLTTAALKSGDVNLQLRGADALISVGRPAGEELTKLSNGIDDSLGFDAAEKYYWHAFSEWHSRSAHMAIVTGLRREGANQWRVLQVMEAGEELHAGDTSWAVSLSMELARASRFSEAASKYSEVVGGLTADQHYSFGYFFLRSDDPTSARMAFSRAIRCDEELNAVKYGIGIFHEKHKRWELAATAFEESAENTSDDEMRAELYHRAGYCSEAALLLTGARKNYDRALEYAPREKKLWFQSGISAELDGDYLEARKRYQVAWGLSDSADSALSFRLGYVHWKLGETTVALDHFARFVGEGDGIGGFEQSLDRVSVAGEVGETSHDIIELAAPTRRLGASAHISWADTFYEIQSWEVAARHYRLGFLAGGITRKKLRRHVESLVKLGLYETACRMAIEWRASPEASPLKLEAPRQGGIEARNISYEQFRRNLAVQPDILMFEASLGLAVDCHPLAISRYILQKFPGKYIHAWVVDGDTPLPVDLEHSADVIVVQKGSTQETRLFASAGYIINNSTFPTHPVLRDEQRYLNTWHGTPLKTMMKDTPEPLDYANISRNLLQATSLFYPSEYAKDKILGRTDLSTTVQAEVEVIGSPRSDGLVRRRLAAGQMTAPNAEILIAPTWRQDSELASEVEKLVSLSRALQGDGRNVRVRAHHYVEAEILRRGVPLNLVPRSLPTNDLLETVDVIVTDYSSVFFDFAITRRPIVFFVPDWEEYRGSRGLYLDKEDLPGQVCHTVEAVREAVVAGRVHETIDVFLDKFGPLEDGEATKRAVDLLFKGPTSGELARRKPTDNSVLLRGEFLANGISSALIAMANALNARAIRVGVITGTDAARNDPVRQQQLDRLDDSIPVIGRVGAMVNSQLQYHARRIMARAQGDNVPALCSSLVSEAYAIEKRRVLGASIWSSVVEYEGYSEFWADFVLGASGPYTSTSIFMHNDIAAEIEMKFPWMERIAKRYSRFDAAVSVSADLATVNEEKLTSLLNVDNLEIDSAKNIVDLDRIRSRKGNLIDEDIRGWLGESSKIILNVGRLSPEKNHTFLIEVMKRVAKIDPDIRLIICGDGPLRNKLQTSIARNGMAPHIKLAGQRDSIYALMDNADLFVLPSKHEGQPIVLLEAGAIGTPCLASNIPSIKPFGKLGARTCKLDADSWAERIISHFNGADRIPDSTANMGSYIEESIAQFTKVVGLNGVV